MWNPVPEAWQVKSDVLADELLSYCTSTLGLLYLNSWATVPQLLGYCTSTLGLLYLSSNYPA